MKNCPEPEELSALIDGELNADSVRELKIHLEDCRDCRSTLAELRESGPRLTALEVPPGRADEMLSAIRTRRPKRTIRIPLSIAATVILLLAVSLLANLYLIVENRPEPRAPEWRTVGLEEYQARSTPADKELARKLERFQLLQKPVILVRPAPPKPE